MISGGEDTAEDTGRASRVLGGLVLGLMLF